MFLLHIRLLNEDSDHYAVAGQYKVERFETVTCLYTELCMRYTRFEIVDEWKHLQSFMPSVKSWRRPDGEKKIFFDTTRKSFESRL